VSSYPQIRFDGAAGSDRDVRDQVFSYLGGSAQETTPGSGDWVRPTNVRLANIEVFPPGMVDSGDPQITSAVDWVLDGVYFHDFVDQAFEDGSGNNHVECLQFGGAQSVHIFNSYFLRGTTHGVFARCWGATAWVPPQTFQDFIFSNCVFRGNYSPSGKPVGTPDVQIVDDLADPSLGPTSIAVIGCAFASGGLHVDIQHGTAVIRGNMIRTVTRYALNLWQAAGYDVSDNVYGEITGNPSSSPFPGDTVDPDADFTRPNLAFSWRGELAPPDVPPDPGPGTCPTCGQPLPADIYEGELAPVKAAWPAMPERP
jgi:hypothetical protein